MKPRVPSVVLAASLLMIAGACAPADEHPESAAPAPDAAPAVAPSTAPDANAPDAKAILKDAGEALKKARALSYTAGATSSVEGSLKHDATVTLARAEAGGWRVRVQGAVAAKDASTPLSVGFDGATAWAIKDKDKAVVTRAIQKDDDAARFLRANSAGPTIAWEFLADDPFAKAIAANPEYVGEATVAGVPCDVVKVAGAAGDDDAPAGGVVVRYAIAKSDRIPRRVERVYQRTGPDNAAIETTRALTMSDLKLDANVAAVAFDMSIPEGYAVRGQARDAAPDKPTPTGDGAPLAGPGVKDKPAAGDAKDDARAAKLPKSNPQLLARGAAAPDFKLKDESGKEWTLADYRGKVLVVDFWGSWCPPCRAAMPGIQKLHEKYKGKDVAVVGFNWERRADANPAKFMKDNAYTYQLLLNADKVSTKYKVPGWPTFYVIDKGGKVLWGDVGYDPGHQKVMEQVIDYALER